MTSIENRPVYQALKNHGIPGYALGEPLGEGKTAIVLDAVHEEFGSCALKVYDFGLIEQFGNSVALERMQRELTLRNHDNPHLVKIYAASEVAFGEQQTCYVAMEKIEGEKPEEMIGVHQFSDAEIRKCLLDMHSAVSFLMSRNLCHRDIKLSNLRRRQNGDFVLLDLGVLRPIGVDSNLTDPGVEKNFVGTLRYAPPEYLHRLETDDELGWTAINLYQMGAAIYELIEGRILFQGDDTPYPTLVRSVSFQTVRLTRKADIGRDLVEFVTGCLQKDPSARIYGDRWNSIPLLCSSPRNPVSPIDYEPVFEFGKRANELYTKQISEPELLLEQEKAVRTEALQIAESAVQMALKNAAGALEDYGATVSWADQKGFGQPGTTKKFHIGFKENLPGHFSGTLLAIVELTGFHRTVGCVTLSGVGIWLSMPQADPSQIANQESRVPFSPQAKMIFDGAPDEDSLCEIVEQWVADVFSTTLKETVSEFGGAIKLINQGIENQRNGVPSKNLRRTTKWLAVLPGKFAEMK